MSEEGTSRTERPASETARELLRQNRPAEAGRVLRLHVKEHGGSAADYMLLGVALAQSGEGLAAIQPLEQAVAIEPENAAAHFNLGQLYRQGGRHREALASFERALQLRPDYPAAAQAAEDLRRAAGPLVAPFAPPAGAASAVAAPLPPFPARGPTDALAVEEDRSPVWARLLRAMGQLILNPGEAIDFGLNRFFNTEGAVGATCLLFVLSVGAIALIAALGPTNRTGTAPTGVVSIPFVVLATVIGAVVNLIATAGAVAAYNRVSGNTDDFISDFGSVAMSFAMISATLTLATVPVEAILAVAGGSVVVVGLALVRSLWALVLQVMVVDSATESGWLPAFVLLFAANFVAGVVTGMVAGLLGVAGALTVAR